MCPDGAFAALNPFRRCTLVLDVPVLHTTTHSARLSWNQQPDPPLVVPESKLHLHLLLHRLQSWQTSAQERGQALGFTGKLESDQSSALIFALIILG